MTGWSAISTISIWIKAHALQTGAERPLSDRRGQSYAVDVIYLANIYPQLRQKPATGSRDKWVEAEMRSFADLSGYITDEHRMEAPETKKQEADFLTRLKYLAAWRETEAKRNMPRGRILRDDTLMDLAGSNPKNDNQLNKIQRLSQKPE